MLIRSTGTRVITCLGRKAFCADSHYGVAPVYAELERRRIQAVIPRRLPQTQRPKEGRLPLSTFPYDPERDVYVCP